MKICSICLQEKSYDLYYKDNRGFTDGYSEKCKQCKKISLYKWREKNKEKWNNYMKEKARTEKYKTVRNKYYERTKHIAAARERTERYRSVKKNYLINNPEKEKMFNFNRNSKRRKIIGLFKIISSDDMKLMYDELGKICFYCGFPAESIDHLIPISRGGDHILSNLVPACRSCNSQKKDQTAQEYLKGISQ